MALSGDDDAMGPVAGLVYEKPAAAPVMFSWGRDKAKKKKHDNIDSAEADAPAPEVSTQAPFDTSVPHQGSWKSETTANYNDEALHGDKEGTAAIPSKSSTDAPFGTSASAEGNWQSEAKSEYTEKALEASPPVDIKHEDVDEEITDSIKSTGCGIGEAVLKAGTGSPKKKRFLTESSLNFRWPHGAVKPKLAHEPHKSQIIYTNEESAALLPSPAPLPDPDCDIISMGLNFPKISESAERFCHLNIQSERTFQAQKHKNHSDRYLLAHHDTTLEKVIEDALNEVSMDAGEALDENSDNDSSIDDESAMSTNAKDAEDKKEIVATPAESEALLALLKPTSSDSVVATTEAKKILQKITEYDTTPLPLQRW